MRIVVWTVRLAAVATLLFTLGCAAGSRVGQTPKIESDSVAVRASLDALNAACAMQDVRAFMELFEDNDDILVVGSDRGEVYQGRRATSEFIQMLFNLPFVFSFDLTNTTIRQDGNVAWIFTDGNMIHTRDRGPGRWEGFDQELSVFSCPAEANWKLEMEAISWVSAGVRVTSTTKHGSFMLEPSNSPQLSAHNNNHQPCRRHL